MSLLVLLLYPWTPSLEKYTRFYEQGLYVEVSSSLLRELERNPDWHEARALLVKAELAQGRLDLALEQLEALKAAGWETPPLELNVTFWTRGDGNLDPDYTEAAVETARRIAEANVTWDWGVELYLQLLLRLERVEAIPGALALFAANHSPVESYDLYFLVKEAWDTMVGDIDAQVLWETSVLLEEKLPGTSWRQNAIWKIAEAGGAEALHAQYPHDIFLASVYAQTLPPQEGLALLRDWEQENTVAPEAQLYYSSVKSMIIGRAETFVHDDLNWIRPDHLLDLAIDRVFMPDTGYILERLEAGGDYTREVDMLRSSLGGPKPYLAMTGYYPVISPDGHWAVARTDSDWRLYNLESGEEVTRIVNPGSMTWTWSGDSSKVAGADWRGYGPITIYDTQGGSFQLGFETENYLPLGWYNKDTLWVQPVRASAVAYTWWGQPLLCNIETGEVAAHPDMDKSEMAFFPGPKDAMGWKPTTGGPSIMLAGKVYQDDRRSLNILSWRRDGSGVIANSGRELYLWSGQEAKPLAITGYFLGWRNSTEFYWLQPVKEGIVPVSPITRFMESYFLSLHSVPSKLMTYNLQTGRIESMGVVGNITAAAGKTALLVKYGDILVIRLP